MEFVDPKVEVQTGTTILAMEFCDGVIIAADSRTSGHSCGVASVCNRVTDKLTTVTDKIYCCRCGSAADTQWTSAVVAHYMNYAENCGEEPLVAHAAKKFSDILYQYQDRLNCAFIVSGWDSQKGGQVYQVQSDSYLSRQKAAYDGSGSRFIGAMLTSEYSSSMSQQACIDLAINCIKTAIRLDAYSGGVVRIGIITKDGMECKIYYNTPTGAPAFISMPEYGKWTQPSKETQNQEVCKMDVVNEEAEAERKRKIKESWERVKKTHDEIKAKEKAEAEAKAAVKSKNVAQLQLTSSPISLNNLTNFYLN